MIVWEEKYSARGSRGVRVREMMGRASRGYWVIR